MPDINTKATVGIELNTQPVGRKIAELETKLDKLNEKKRQFEAAGDQKGLVKIQKEINKVSRQLDTARTASERCKAALAKLNESSPKELRHTLKQLKADLDHMERGSAAWKAHVEAIKRVKAEIKSVDAELREHEGLLSRINRKVNEWSMSIASAAAAFTGLVFTARQAVQAYADMEAEMANVRKFTGMTADEVGELNEAFKGMDTRTSREDLNKLAQEAGRLGLQSQEDVLGFVKAADQINVALDDLGEGATLTLSKLTDIFGDKDRLGVEQSLLAVGSVINELSQNCTASAPYLANFATRVGGMGKIANMTIPEIMGFAAVLDSTGQAVEMSATAVGQLIQKLFNDPAKIAKATGMDLQAFSKVLKEDTNEALLMLLERLNELGDMSVLAPVLDDMGTDGARASQVIAALAGNVDMLKQQQQAANVAFQEGTSVSQEYEIQNNTVQAQLDKAKNDFHEIAVELGQKLAPAMKYAISGTSAMMRLLSGLVTFLNNNKRAVVALSAAIAAYTVVTKAHNALTAVSNALQQAQSILMKVTTTTLSPLTAAYHLCAAGINNMMGNTFKARAQMAAFNATCAANPIGAVVAALAAAAAAFAAFSNSARVAERETNALTQATDNAVESREKEKLILSENIKKLEAFNGDQVEAQRIVKELNNKYGPLLGTYKDVASWLSVLRTRGDEWINTCYRQMVIEGKLEYARQLIAKAQAEREKTGQYDPGWWDTFSKMTSDWMLDLHSGAGWTGWDKAASELKQARDEIYERNADYYESEAERIVNEAMSDAEEIGYTVAGVVGDAVDAVVPDPPRFTPMTENRGHGSVDHEDGDSSSTDDKKMKAEIEALTAKKNDELTKLNDQYRKGELQSNDDYVDKQYNRTKQYYSDVLAVYKKYGQDQSKDAADVRTKQADDEAKHDKEMIERKKRSLEQQRDADKMAAQMRYYEPDSEIFHNQQALDNELAKIDIDYLEKVRDLTVENTKERADAELALEKAKQAEILRQRKVMDQNYQTWLYAYSLKGAKERMAAELAVLKEVYDKGKIAKAEYEQGKAAIEKKYRDEIDSKTGTSVRGQAAKDAELEKDQRLTYLEQAKAEGLVTEEEYQHRRWEIISNYHDKISELVKGEGSEWTTMATDLVTNWQDLFTNLGDNLPDILENIGDAAAATFAVMNAGLQSYSNYMKAETDYQEKLIEEKAKKGEISEEEKEKAIKNLKIKANKRAQKIEMAQAVASTALGAIRAYTSALEAGFPLGLVLAPIAAAAALAAGAVQIATIKKQHQVEQMGYYEGGFTGRDPNNRREVGVVHANEFVANHQAVANPELLPVLRLIDQAQRNNTVGSLTSEDVSRAIGQGAILGDVTAAQQRTAAREDRSMQLVAASMEQQTAAINELNARLADGIESFMVMDGERGFNRSWQRYQRMKNNPRR